MLCFLRTFCRRRLIAVVSQRGDRYAEKLPLIGRVAEEVSDRILVSAHGPDTGDYDRVIRATLAGLRDPDAAVSGVDRPFLLAAALGTARPGDIVVSLYRGPNTGPDGLPSDRALFQSLL